MIFCTLDVQKLQYAHIVLCASNTKFRFFATGAVGARADYALTYETRVALARYALCAKAGRRARSHHLHQ